MEQTSRPVVFGDGSGLRAVCLQPGFENFGVIVAARGLTSLARFLGTTRDADQKHLFIDLQLKDCMTNALAASSRSKASACATVRGNPSRTKPSAASEWSVDRQQPQ